MPLYFFHIRTADRIEKDQEGIEFADLNAAEIDARSSLFEMMADELAAGRPSKLVGIDITDIQGTILAAVHLSSAIKR